MCRGKLTSCMAMELKTLSMGNGADDSPIFTPHMKLMTLVHAVGEVGIIGWTLQREESVDVNMQKFVTVHQGTCEDFRDCLLD